MNRSWFRATAMMDYPGCKHAPLGTDGDEIRFMKYCTTFHRQRPSNPLPNPLIQSTRLVKVQSPLIHAGPRR
jgi:hypothetical protein